MSKERLDRTKLSHNERKFVEGLNAAAHKATPTAFSSFSQKRYDLPSKQSSEKATVAHSMIKQSGSVAYLPVGQSKLSS